MVLKPTSPGTYDGEKYTNYYMCGTDPNAPDNRWLREAMQRQIPVISFLGNSPAHYQHIIPIFSVGWNPESLWVQLAFGAIVGASAQAASPEAPERRYALREVKARLYLRHRFEMRCLRPMEDGARSHICPNRDCWMRRT